MSSLPFVPRSLTARKHNKTVPPPFIPSASVHALDAVEANPEPAQTTGRATGGTDKLHALLLTLALSDHALWADPTLRDPNRDGFVVLGALLRTSPVFASISSLPSEVTIVKALRAHAEDAFDIRMIMVNTARSTRSASETGGYELRRRDWHSVLQQFHTFDRKYWHLRTIYIENIPSSHRSISDVVRFLTSVRPSSSTDRIRRFQNISFPIPSEDSLAKPPRCRGFALVILSRLEDVETLLLEWPWDRPYRQNDSPLLAADEPSQGTPTRLRALSRARWEQLQDEYAAYRADLLSKMAASSVVNRVPHAFSSGRADVKPDTKADDHSPRGDAVRPMDLDPSAPYPPNCLVFVRNVNSETNKTALRALFSAALLEGGGDLPPDGIDYVDFNKGLDTCYLRLATPRHAHALVAHFTLNLTVQANGLDSSGAPAALNTSQKPLEFELVQGRREEVYWERVPEKVRRQAVQRAREVGQQREGSGRGAKEVVVAASLEEESQARKRRRRHK
ncbi:hypothetical protein HETIRDRAFT_311772 [Heterobasidion irregulare TC 32-1]|uniref:XRRM domain-containing protein n=1 Tax=Heterobasidion irregulare (strain TC 32-1) TaxID=747525 RepID=W4KCG6_HETIT|nr:uncharacterized protein HETIRDRAFT_311772 [Heterobasidion irregulare TC 32-1]ETW83557.1 hypothetical protein HETIRDRAFT_311772 [Heterobasidion irregulare TC 32-1]